MLPALEMPSLWTMVTASRPSLKKKQKQKKTSLPYWIHHVGLNDKVSLPLTLKWSYSHGTWPEEKRQRVLLERLSHQTLLRK